MDIITNIRMRPIHQTGKPRSLQTRTLVGVIESYQKWHQRFYCQEYSVHRPSFCYVFLASDEKLQMEGLLRPLCFHQ